MRLAMMTALVFLSALLPPCHAAAQEEDNGQEKEVPKQEEKTNRLVEQLKDTEPLRRIDAIRELEKAGESAINLLIPVLQDSDTTVRITVAEALSRIGDARILDPFTEALKDKEPKVRAIAAGKLGTLGDKKAIEPLTEMLKDESKEACCAAIEALVSLGATSAAEKFEKLWKEGSGKSVRLAAAFAMTKLAGDEEAFNNMLEALGDKDIETRRYDARLLGRTGRKEAVEPLLKAMSDKWVHHDALQSLTGMGKTAVDMLLRVAGGEDEALRGLALEALATIADPGSVDVLVQSLRDKNERIRGLAADGLAKIGKPAVSALIELVKGEDIVVRVHAARTLEKITEKDFGLDYDKWKAWYEENKNK